MWRIFLLIIAFSSVLLAGASLSFADAIDGVYLRQNNLSSSELRVFDCGGGKGIKIETSTHKPSVGKIIMCGAKPKGKGWSGKILNLEDGIRYSATLSNSGSRLKIRGCIIGSLLCENQFLPRVQ